MRKSRRQFTNRLGMLILVSLLAHTGMAGVTFFGPQLLGRPTDHSVTVNAVADCDLEVYFEYGTETGVYSQQTPVSTFLAGEPLEVVIDNLQPDTRYYYRMCRRIVGESDYQRGQQYSFQTQRQPGSAFTFTIQADAHNYRSTIDELRMYETTLSNIAADNPDFHIDLGDTFDMDAVGNAAEARAAYLAERPFFGLVAHSSPLFFVLGNHENEEGWYRNGTADNEAIWSVNARKLYYPNPIPDGFYTGNTRIEDFVDGDGLPENYYAWEWGDALFVVLDPYWYTTTSPYDENLGKDNWRWTLGYEQYQWSKQTLETSTREFKFVFAHHMTGGVTSYGRGGIEGASYYEWGGLNKDDTWGFDENRPGWDMPIHDLMVANGVDVFFHGHDHVYVKQDLDGIVYQEVPTPTEAIGHNDSDFDGILYGTGHLDHNAGYTSGEIVENSGHLRVSVSQSHVTVDYVRAYLPEDENAQLVNGMVSHSYTIEKDTRTVNSSKYVKDALVHSIRTKPAIHETPVVMLPGRNLSSYIYLSTPDGRKGWGQLFAEQGYDVYVVNSPELDFLTGGFSVDPFYVPVEAAPAQDPSSTRAWQRDVWPLWGFGYSAGNPYADCRFPTDHFQTFEANYPYVGSTRRSFSDAVIALLEEIGPSILLAHSAGSSTAVTVATQRPDLVTGFILIEPAGPPDADDFPALAGKSMLGIYGDYIDHRNQSGRKAATEEAAGLFNRNGGVGDVISLPDDYDIFGNTHLMMQDDDSDLIAQMIMYWITHNLVAQ